MFNNYNLFKYWNDLLRYGQYGGGSKKRKSYAEGLNTKEGVSLNRFKNMKERVKENDNLKVRLHAMKSERNELFEKINSITKKERKWFFMMICYSICQFCLGIQYSLNNK